MPNLSIIELGHGKSTLDRDGMLWLSSISESEKSELVNLIKTGQDSVLQRAFLRLSSPFKYVKYWGEY